MAGPPLTARVSPLTNDAASLTRNRIGSRDLDRLPDPAHRVDRRHLCLVESRDLPRRDHTLGGDETDRDAVAADAPPSPFGRGDPGEHLERGLGRE